MSPAEPLDAPPIAHLGDPAVEPAGEPLDTGSGHVATAPQCPTDVDLADPEQLRLAVRIGLAWIELRRGAAMSTLRDHLFGSGDDALEQGQMDTLDLFAHQPTWRMSELAEALRVDPSTATRAVQRLVRSGLATRNASDDDGRVVMVSITDAGVARHAEVAERRGRLMAYLMGMYTPDERVQLADLLERFIGAVDGFVSRTDP